MGIIEKVYADKQAVIRRKRSHEKGTLNTTSN